MTAPKEGDHVARRDGRKPATVSSVITPKPLDRWDVHVKQTNDIVTVKPSEADPGSWVQVEET